MAGEGRISELPDKMTGKDLLVQEEYEAGIDRSLFDSMDSVDRRDKRLHIVSKSFSKKGKENYDRINWHSRGEKSPHNSKDH